MHIIVYGGMPAYAAALGLLFDQQLEMERFALAREGCACDMDLSTSVEDCGRENTWLIMRLRQDSGRPHGPG